MRNSPLTETRADLRRKRFKKIILFTALFAIWAAVFWRAIHVFAPSTALGSFSSDEAISVLMSNDNRPITLFNLYYYGAGRWGGWPFLFMQVVRRATGYRWSDRGLFIAQTAWVFLGALVVAGLCSAERVISGLIYLLTICLHGGVSMRVFTLSQVYAWQITALLLGWYALRRFLDSRPSLTKKQTLVSRLIWGGMMYWFSFLSIWSSATSIPILFFLVALEGLRAHWTIDKNRTVQSLRRPLVALLLIALATCFELLMRSDYHRHNLKHYHFEYRWQVAVDRGYLLQNLHVQADNLLRYEWWRVFYLLSLMSLLVLVYSFVNLLWRNKIHAREKFRQAINDDPLVLNVAVFGIALINFIVIVLADHVRINLYDNRFMTLTYLFASVSGLLSLWLVLKWILQRWTALPLQVARSGFVLAMLIAMIFQFPPVTRSAQYAQVKEISATLERRAPRAPLMGGYWDTYLFVAQQSGDAMTPVPLEGQDLRTPWTPAALRTAPIAVLEYGHGHFPVPETLSQHGAVLKLVEQKWYENGEYAFALYANEKK